MEKDISSTNDVDKAGPPDAANLNLGPCPTPNIALSSEWTEDFDVKT